MGKKRAIKRKKSSVEPLNSVFAVICVIILVIIGIVLVYDRFIAYKPCANSISCIKDLSGAYEEETNAVFMGKQIKIPEEIGKRVAQTETLGESTGQKKHIYVDLSSQHLYAYEGDKLVLSFPVSTGKWYPTPTGDFNIWIKLRQTRMSGGNPAYGTYYNLPNVPYTMYFYNKEVSKARGFGLHGAYWHNNFGHPMSHGCINISPENAEKLYNWANPVSKGNTTYASAEDPGTPLTIFGVTPKE